MSYLRKYNAKFSVDNVELPFVPKLNFSKLLEYWENKAEFPDEEIAKTAKLILARFGKNHALRKPISDWEKIEELQDELSILFKPIFPDITTYNEIKAAALPFVPVFFNMTKRMEALVEGAGNENIVMRMEDADEMYISACVFILKFTYGTDFRFNKTMYFDAPNAEGVMRHYRAFFNADFSEFKERKGFKELTQDDIHELKDNFTNVELWKEKIPPGSFDFEGFGLVTLLDVTADEAVSSLKVDLLKKDALLSPEIVEEIKERMNSMLGLKDLRLGFAAFDAERDSLKTLGYGFWNSIILSDKHQKKSSEIFCHNTKEHMMNMREPLVIPLIDESLAEESPLVAKLVGQKIKSYLAVPLVYNDELVGVLELGSPNGGDLDSVVARNLREVVPLFTISMKRSLDEFETKLEAIIQEKCTAIHPSVAWRFFEAAENLLKLQRFMDANELEDIEFPDVYPLYGQSDIKGSSTARNSAIQEDTIEQLEEARNVLDLGIKHTPLPIYKELKFRINKYIKKMKKGLGAGDEISVQEFLKREIYPVFNHLESLADDLEEAVKTYQDKLDPSLGVIYNKRKDYEDSVSLLNHKMSDFIEKAQVSAQLMFPHYFEKYKTDGVEHNMYIGQSMVSSRNFDAVYLQNLRLWQLLVICETENEVYRLKPQLKVKLGICSLILVHSNSISIKFRKDEKQFDVDGAYNIRYEIIKKRIDKSIIKGTKERLTQPGKIAIVYSQDAEAREYMNYLEYLQSINYIGPEIEWLDIEDLQGVTGMKALRVSVVFHKDETCDNYS